MQGGTKGDFLEEVMSEQSLKGWGEPAWVRRRFLPFLITSRRSRSNVLENRTLVRIK